MAISIVIDSATISTTEYFLASDSTTATYQTTDAVMQCFIDFNAMTAAETYTVKVYEKVNAGTARPVLTSTLVGVQSALWVSPSYLMGEGWEISVIKVAGTDRSIAWSIRTAT